MTPEIPEVSRAPKEGKQGAIPPDPRRQLLTLAAGTAVLALCFARPLYGWVRFALDSQLYSHLVLIPFVSVYLAWLRLKAQSPKSKIQSPNVDWAARPDRKLALLPLGVGLLVAVSYLLFAGGLGLGPQDLLAWSMFAFVLLFVGLAMMCLGAVVVRVLAFPLAFLIFAVPFPAFLESALEGFLQHWSAVSAGPFFTLAGTPYLRDGMKYQLPGFSLSVAPECSGIHSSLVLFISSLVAGQLFLRSNWKRALFAALVVPLGILRNAFRIAVIGELCSRVDPSFIDSPLHRKGGPVFFVVSLVPFGLLLWWMARKERGSKSQVQSSKSTLQKAG